MPACLAVWVVGGGRDITYAEGCGSPGAGLDNYSTRCTLQAEPWTHAEIPTPFQYRRGEIGGKVCPLTTKNYDTTFNRFWC